MNNENIWDKYSFLYEKIFCINLIISLTVTSILQCWAHSILVNFILWYFHISRNRENSIMNMYTPLLNFKIIKAWTSLFHLYTYPLSDIKTNFKCHVIESIHYTNTHTSAKCCISMCMQPSKDQDWILKKLGINL